MQTGVKKEILSNQKYEIQYELYQSYSRFNVYDVYKVYLKTGEKKFLYRTTKERYDFGKKLLKKSELLSELKKRLEVMHAKKREDDATEH